ncbi:bifunctional diguanylate cyclase/phosphodiesterase [Massilia glaciei]|uniref:GGDEF domain-containing protein n=2 Tax=Pseudomonadati TaxID=3379134 RepID=A0A2U2HPK6_9BURK|nr:EAL domain-containing protein [Massilia glaciei]PWF49356.1 GGDEF domain-containing protein [Massilia glaciei]
MPLRRPPLSISAAAVLTLAGGMAASAALFAAVAGLEYDKMALHFERRANARVAAIDAGLDEAVEVLTVTNNLFAAVNPVTRAQFHDFTTPLLLRYPFIKAFNFHRRLPHSERAAAEAALQALVPGTVLTEMRGGKLVTAPPRPFYSVVDYLTPMRGNEAAFGLNVSPNRTVMDALDVAVATGGVAATGLLTLAQVDRPNSAFEAIMPVYRAGAPLATAPERRAALAGDTAAIIMANDLVNHILARGGLMAEPDVLVWVYAGERAEPGSLVYRSEGAGAAPPPGASPRAGFKPFAGAGDQEHLVRRVRVADKFWRIELGAAARPFAVDHFGSLAILVGAILFTLLMTAFVETLVQRSRRVQRLVNERTADLELSNQRLIDDVLARKKAEKALQQSELRFRQLVTMSSDWYWEQDAELRFINITGGLVEKSGVPLTRLLGKTRWESVPGMEESDWGRAHMALLRARQPFTRFEYESADKDGAMRWYCINGEPLFDEQGQFTGYRGTGSDITAAKQAEQRVHHVAQHDALTGLPNRSLLHDRLGQAVAYASRTGHPIWVMLIDLDRFKFVNDSMGHKAGDVLLMTVAARLRGALRETDTVARLSGDEFVVILTEHHDERLAVDIVRRLMDAVAQPVLLGGKEFFVTASIGVAVFPTDGGGIDNLIEHADIAMYRAKKLGRNNFQFYTPAMNEEALERVRIESALRNALERDEFVLHYQPQVELASGQIVGMEALIRWQHPELGMVPPVRFIGVAEDTGLIVPIGAWVLRTACAQNKAWLDAGLGRLRVAVNLSARQFAAPNLIAQIEAVLADTGLPPACLDIELTESLFMDDITVAVELLHSMKALGVSMSIDDFGTGYSSLSYLSRFPIDVLKIDRSFVSAINRDANDAALVSSIIALAHNLKLSVIAEGVETAEQLAYLRGHGCDEMQGYFFSKPVPAAEFEQMLRQRRRLDIAEPEDAITAS